MKKESFRVLSTRDELTMAPTRRLYDYWLSIKGDQEAPMPSDFNVLDLSDIVSQLAWITATNSAEQFVLRFQGQDNVLLTGFDATGRSTAIDENDAFQSRSLQVFTLALESRKPVINGPTAMKIHGKEHIIIETLTVPMIENGVVAELVSIMATMSPNS